METATAGKFKNILDNGAASFFDSFQRWFQIIGVENDQCATVRLDRCRCGETARHVAIGKLAILRAVILELPAEYVAIKGL
ncbi:hypothetical protein D3C80_2003140 [compost metagenome]